MGIGLFRLVLIASMVAGLSAAIPDRTIAADQQISVATLLEQLHQQVPNKAPLSRFFAAKSCSKDCGMSSGSTTCNDNQSCDCACNRQPICECR
jgi:hypothetical protein